MHREKTTTAGMQEVEQRMEQLPRMTGYGDQAVILFRSPHPNPFMTCVWMLPVGEGINGTAVNAINLILCVSAVSLFSHESILAGEDR